MLHSCGDSGSSLEGDSDGDLEDAESDLDSNLDSDLDSDLDCDLDGNLDGDDLQLPMNVPLILTMICGSDSLRVLGSYSEVV